MGEGFGGSRFKVLYGPSFWVTKETCVEESIAGSGTRAEPLEAAVQSNGKDNLLTSTVAPVVVPDSLPPRHQTLSPLLPRHLLVSCMSLGLIQEIL